MHAHDGTLPQRPPPCRFGLGALDYALLIGLVSIVGMTAITSFEMGIRAKLLAIAATMEQSS